IHFPSGSFAGRLQVEPRGFLESPNMGIAEPRNASYRAACDAGVRALLTGDIADGCVAGLPLVLDSLLRHGNFRRFLSDFRTYRRVTEEPLHTTLTFACAG